MFTVSTCAHIIGGRILQETGAAPHRVIHDSRLVRPGDLFVALPGAHTDGHMFLNDAFSRGACGAIISDTSSIPKSAHDLIVVDDTLAALTRLARAWRDELPGVIIGITGTCGKTTTKVLLGRLLSAQGETFVAPRSYNTNIGLPIAILSMPKTAKFGVFELGANAPGEIYPLARLLTPDIAIITMVGRGHLAGFGSVEGVAREKWSLVDALPGDGTAIINLDSPPLFARACTYHGRLITVGAEHGDIRGRIVRVFPGVTVETDSPSLRLETHVLGRHNLGNLLLAVACALHLGVPEKRVVERIRTFTPPPHRLNLISAPFGYILDDTYNANPDSTSAALHTLAELPARQKAFVFGEMRELGKDSSRYHREILSLALKLGISPIYPVGEIPARIAERIGSQKVRIIPRDALPAQIRTDLDGKENILLIKGSRALGLETLIRDVVRLGKGAIRGGSADYGRYSSF